MAQHSDELHSHSKQRLGQTSRDIQYLELTFVRAFDVNVQTRLFDAHCADLPCWETLTNMDQKQPCHELEYTGRGCCNVDTVMESRPFLQRMPQVSLDVSLLLHRRDVKQVRNKGEY